MSPTRTRLQQLGPPNREVPESWDPFLISARSRPMPICLELDPFQTSRSRVRDCTHIPIRGDLLQVLVRCKLPTLVTGLRHLKLPHHRMASKWPMDTTFRPPIPHGAFRVMIKLTIAKLMVIRLRMMKEVTLSTRWLSCPSIRHHRARMILHRRRCRPPAVPMRTMTKKILDLETDLSREGRLLDQKQDHRPITRLLPRTKQPNRRSRLLLLPSVSLT